TYTNEACATTGYTLTVTAEGSGGGTVTSIPSIPAGVSCGATCSVSYASGTVVTLTAVPSAGSLFAGWSGGGCPGTGPCTVTLTVATTVTAPFIPQTAAMIVTGPGPGAAPTVAIFPEAAALGVSPVHFLAYAPTFAGGVFVAAGDVTGD